MSYQSIIFLLVASLNLFLGIFIYFRNTKSPINFYFLLMVLCAAFWNFCLLGYSFNFDSQYLRTILIQIIYICVLLVSFYYFIFCYHFPYRSFNMPKGIFPALYVFVLLYSLLISLKWDYLFSYIPENSTNDIINFPNYLVFSIIFGLFFLFGFIMLFKKYLYIDGIYKKQLKYVLWGTGLSFILASAFNLFPNQNNSWSLYWVGPIFTLINAGTIASLIFFSNFKIVRQ